jgi:RNA polymerase sigma-54 factor
LDDLANKRYNLLAKRLRADLKEIKSAVKEISLLEPKPARQFSHIEKSSYVVPDIFIMDEDENGNYKIVINDKEIPVLRINQFYQSLLNKKEISKDEKKFIRDRIQSGQNLIKSINMRNETIKRLVEYVVQVQREFLEKGKQYIKPLTIKEVAEKINRDESTISRAINNKYIDTPQGIFKLKSLFSTAVKPASTTDTTDIEVTSSASIKEQIYNLIMQEDKTKPLSDSEIAEKINFKNKNINISRRTIAKYRKELKILPSHLRKI